MPASGLKREALLDRKRMFLCLRRSRDGRVGPRRGLRSVGLASFVIDPFSASILGVAGGRKKRAKVFHWISRGKKEGSTEEESDETTCRLVHSHKD